MNPALQQNKKKRKSLRKKLTSFKALESINLAAEAHYEAIYTETGRRICNKADVQSLHEISSLRSTFSALGAVSDKEDYYFDSTETSQRCAKLFFKNAIQNPKHCGFLKNNSKENTSNKAPRCISFITGILTTKNTAESEGKLCFVVLSGSEKNKTDREKLKHAIVTSVQKMGNDTLSGHKFQFLDPSTETFSKTLNHINRRLDPDIDPSTKPCAEKKYISAILGLEYGYNFEVTGVSNYGLHPFKQEEQDDLDFKTKYPGNAVRSIDLEIEGETCFIPEINCCEECKRNKMSALLVLSHYQRLKDTESDVSALSDYIPSVELSEATNQYLLKPDDCASISGTRSKMTLPSWPSSRASSVTRSRGASFASHASQTSSGGLSIRFEDLKLSQDSTDPLVDQTSQKTSSSSTQNTSKFRASFFQVKQESENQEKSIVDLSQEKTSFETLMSDLQEDTRQSRKTYAELFQDTSSSLPIGKEKKELEKKAKEKQEKNKLRTT